MIIWGRNGDSFGLVGTGARARLLRASGVLMKRFGEGTLETDNFITR